MTNPTELITVAEAAKIADRSKTVVRRWILEGWLDLALQVPGRNGTWLLNKSEFEEKLPAIAAEMAKRKGGRGNKSTDAYGKFRGESA
jgi:hypothetical protein